MSTFRERLREADRFFVGRGKVHRTMRRITRRLEREGIPYALIGGMAMNAHGFQRVTTDVDLLTTREGLDELHNKLVGREFVPRSPGARKKLTDTVTGVDVDFVVTDDYPDPREVSVGISGLNVIRLEKLIEMKLISGKAPLQIRDLGDAQDLIKALSLPRSLGEQIDPTVRDEYYRLWDASQNGWDPSAE